MTTNQVINLDCTEKKNQNIIQKVLRQIKPLSKYSDEEDIPFNAIEKAITVMCKKYTMKVNQLVPDMWANDEHTIWRAWLINDTNLKTIEMVYGVTLYEVFAKVAIRLYAEVKKGIKTRK
jgi:hypothetical protein